MVSLGFFVMDEFAYLSLGYETDERSSLGKASDRRRWRMKGGWLGAAVKIGSDDSHGHRFWVLQEGKQTRSICEKNPKADGSNPSPVTNIKPFYTILGGRIRYYVI